MDLQSYLAVCGWFVQVIFDKYLSHMLEAWASDFRIQQELENLRFAVLNIQTVLATTWKVRDENGVLLQWLKELKDASYAAEDLFDELEYQRLRYEVEGTKDRNLVSDFLSPRISNAMSFLATGESDASSSSSSEKEITTVGISKIVKQLDSVASGMNKCLKLLKLGDVVPRQQVITSSRITSSFLAINHQVFGRDKEKEEIIDTLLRPQPEDVGFGGGRNVFIVPIIGIGGVGKTTLAQLVYNDERVESYFDRRIWVCVSESFSVIRLTREILEHSCDDQYTGITNLNRLQVILREKLMGNRFLLVLDDVWNDGEKRRWDTLFAPMKHGKEGSSILITSRLETIVKMMGTSSPIRLEGLQEDDYWSFFKECAFGGVTVHHNQLPSLQEIGKRIAGRLKGSPLAAKTLGGLLKDNLDPQFWTSILKSDIWRLEQGPDDIMPVLKLSYQNLPAHLQQCFAYCSLFPKNWEFQPDKLVRMWMAQGFVVPNDGNKTIEAVGRDYFDYLLSRSFFQKFECHGGAYYIMHDLLHDLAEYVSKDDCFRIEGDEPKKIPITVRHLSVMTLNLDELKQNVFVLRNLRTLMFLNFSFFNFRWLDSPTLQQLFEELKSIRLLSGCYVEKLPESVDHLIHLRYLHICYSGIKVLPDSLSRLYHLQTLILEGGIYLGLPMCPKDLPNLRHFVCDHKIIFTKL